MDAPFFLTGQATKKSAKRALFQNVSIFDKISMTNVSHTLHILATYLSNIHHEHNSLQNIAFTR
jgi:hypothetical protein